METPPLRYSALTSAAEDGTSTPTLLARSRPASVHSWNGTRCRVRKPSPAVLPSMTQPVTVGVRDGDRPRTLVNRTVMNSHHTKRTIHCS
jgi:hypothetical protein